MAQVKSAPVIVGRLPENITLLTGGTTASVDASRTLSIELSFDTLTPFTVQWYKDGKPVTSVRADLTSLVISNAQLSDSGDYYATVTNTLGTVTSNTCRLKVVESLAITKGVAIPVGAEGMPATLSIAARGEPPLKYQWYKSGAPLDGATQDHLSIIIPPFASPSAPVDTYSVRVSNEYQELTNVEVPVRATLPDPPIVTKPLPKVIQTAPSRLVELASAFLVANAPSLKSEWRKNGQVLPTTFPTFAMNVVAGSTPGTTDEYALTASNAWGSVTQTCRVIVSAPLQIITQPADQTVSVGDRLSLSVAVAGGTEPYSFQWFYGPSLYVSVPLSGATSPVLILDKVTKDHAYFYYVNIIGGDGSHIVSRDAKVSVTGNVPAVTPPFFLKQPSDLVITTGFNISLDCTVLGATSYQWRKDGAPIPPPLGNSASIIVTAGKAGSVETYDVIASNAIGSTTSQPARVRIYPPGTLIQFLALGLPTSQTAVAGGAVRIAPTVLSDFETKFQWSFNGAVLPNATNAVLDLYNVTSSDAGTYVLQAKNSIMSDVSVPYTLSVTAPSARMINLSVRTQAGTQAEALIAGFAVSGGGTKTLLARGVGPALAAFGVTGGLADPEITLRDQSNRLVATARGHADPALANVAVKVGAFPLPSGSQDAAASSSVPAGAFTLQVSSVGGSTGTALAEIYDSDDPSASSRLTNVSARAQVVGGSQPLIAGFSVSGTGSITVVVRGVGPGLTRFGAAGVLPGVKIELHSTVNGQDRILAANSGWGGSEIMSNLFSRVGAFALRESAPDAALIATLDPGPYTIVLSGEGVSGVSLVEVYALQ